MKHETEIAISLWSDFGDISVNNQDEIEETFLHFPKGTNKHDIWHWFENTFDLSIVDIIT